jgi:sarcosine oxidase subunit gamma
MPELRSALTGHLRLGRFGAAGEPLILSERPLGTLIQLSGWPEGFEGAVRPLLARLGFQGCGSFDRAQLSDKALAFRISPERLLLRLKSAGDWAEVDSGIDQALTPVLDLSHSRTVIRVAGANAAALLARLLPIDFEEQAFGPGRFVQSGIHTVAVLVHRDADEAGVRAYDIYVPRSFAASTWDLITRTAMPFGYRVDAGG